MLDTTTSETLARPADTLARIQPSGFRKAGAWGLQLLAAALLGQTLFFKFSGAPESRHIFTTLGVEPWGRLGTGVLELAAVLLLLSARTSVLGAALGVALMVGAIGSHLGPLGIEVLGDGGLLFGLAGIVLVSSLGVLFLRAAQVKHLVSGASALVRRNRDR